MSIIPFTTSQGDICFYRDDFFFLSRNVRLKTFDGDILLFPCIGLYHKKTGMPAGYPGYERWLYNLRLCAEKRSQTLWRKSVHLCSFLNFILWETDCDSIHDISLTNVRDFLLYYRVKPNNAPRDPKEWLKGIADVFTFLTCYIQANNSTFIFRLKPEDLITTSIIYDAKRRRQVVTTYHLMSVKPPTKTQKKNRLLIYEYLDLLLYEAKKYDPMLTLGIMLQAYAGLREGEIVNLTCSSISKIYAGFGIIGKLIIDLTHEADFSKHHTRKTPFGAIKVYRTQEVFPTFISQVTKEIDEHERLLSIAGLSIDAQAPLFVSKWRKPMSVKTYTERLKILFITHFIPDLRALVEKDGTLPANAPYLEAYEREYPGAHMLRHWYTMYLLQHTHLTSEEISKWRGDAHPDSMKEYIHLNSDFIDAFCESIFKFQRTLLEEIL